MLSFGFNASFARFSLCVRPLYELCAVTFGAPCDRVGQCRRRPYFRFHRRICVRLNVSYLSLLTLAFAQFLYAIALKWRSVTKGEDGLIVRPPSIDVPFFGSADLGSNTNALLRDARDRLHLPAAELDVHATAVRLFNNPCKENEERAKFLGYNTYLFKLAVFTVSGTFAGVAGDLRAILQKLVAPDLFGLGPAGDVLMVTILEVPALTSDQ